MYWRKVVACRDGRAQQALMGAIHKIGVAASLLLIVHATLCAIQRAPPRRAGLLSSRSRHRPSRRAPKPLCATAWHALTRPVLSATDYPPVPGCDPGRHLGRAGAQGRHGAHPDDGGALEADHGRAAAWPRLHALQHEGAQVMVGVAPDSTARQGVCVCRRVWSGLRYFRPSPSMSGGWAEKPHQHIV
eukprot:scaffold58190_cov64-Phaeocystis_antarctica.AAC.7